MAISLKKGEGVSLRKEDHDLSSVTIGLGWDIAEEKRGLLSKLLKANSEAGDYDLDAIAFLLDADGKVADLGAQSNGKPTLVGGDVVFFNSLKHPSGHIWLTGDNRTGDGDGDDEQIIVRLNDLSPTYQRIVFVVAIYQGRKKEQHFGKVKNAFIRAVDARGRELARYDISGTGEFSGCCALTFAEVARQGGGWQFRAVGIPHETDSFVDILRQYV